MPGETANIAEVANKVSEDIFKWFKWEKHPVMDQNFTCHKAEQHKNKSRKKNTEDEKHQHPVDVVFKYFDPYLNKQILLNTDLKSYSKRSITPSRIKDALNSLGKTIDCARSSGEWQKRYVLNNDPYEIRGMLFIYNYDNSYDNDFYGYFEKINVEKLWLREDQLLHLIEPQRIRYLNTVVADMMRLSTENELPKDDYSFFYPDLFLHKSHGDSDKYPASIEMLCSPYMIIKHEKFKNFDQSTGQEISESPAGYVIYYNQDGSTEYEFMYLFDSLSRYQILSSKSKIKIRVAHHAPYTDIKSNFAKAIETYVRAWGFDEHKKKDLLRIEFDTVTMALPQYMPGLLAWRS